jgi:hypothetical protein
VLDEPGTAAGIRTDVTAAAGADRVTEEAGSR